MKVLLFNVSKDETGYINKCNRKFGFELTMADFDFNSALPDAFVGFDAVWITTNCKVSQEKAEELKRSGIRFIVSRAAGTDHMDLPALEKAGIKGANVPGYSPNAIAEHTVCLVLMCLRKMKRELNMVSGYDFTLSGLKGRELHNMTVGVIGTGKIGAETVKIIKGFGSQILAFDLYENTELTGLVTYKDRDEVLKMSDILILHCPLTKENYRFINTETITKMKAGAVLINTARGGLVDYGAVLKGIEDGKLSSVAFDVYDGETPYIRKKIKQAELQSETLKKLMEKENVIYTAHMSFFTDTAIENMIRTTFKNLEEYWEKGKCSNEITGRLAGL